MKTTKYLLYIITTILICSSCSKDNDIDNQSSILLGTWIEGKDSPYYSSQEILVYVFKENGECTEYVTNENGGKVGKFDFYYEFNPKNRVLKLTSKKAGYTYYTVIKFIDNNTVIFYDDDFLEDNGYSEENLPVDDKHYNENYNDINCILHKGEYPLNWN